MLACFRTWSQCTRPSDCATLAILVNCSLEPRCHSSDASVTSEGIPSAHRRKSGFHVCSQEGSSPPWAGAQQPASIQNATVGATSHPPRTYRSLRNKAIERYACIAGRLHAPQSHLKSSPFQDARAGVSARTSIDGCQLQLETQCLISTQCLAGVLQLPTHALGWRHP